MESLKPCPHCGAGGAFEENATRIWVKCPCCGAMSYHFMKRGSPGTLFYPAAERAAENWNRRPEQNEQERAVAKMLVTEYGARIIDLFIQLPEDHQYGVFDLTRDLWKLTRR